MYIIAKQALAWQELIKMIIDNFQLQVWLEKIAPSTSNDLEHGHPTFICLLFISPLYKHLDSPLLQTNKLQFFIFCLPDFFIFVWIRKGCVNTLKTFSEVYYHCNVDCEMLSPQIGVKMFLSLIMAAIST